jgi:anionic cell wall polymer biosynthesis LytR-Cps2A-Psr (LCP) family protein
MALSLANTSSGGGINAVRNGFQRRLAVVLLLAGVVIGSGALAGPTLAAPRIKYGPGAWLSIAGDALRISGLTGALRGLVGPTSVNYGNDGRLSVMVIGSDYRPGGGGERMDAVMVMTINPATHQVAAVSIPRDTGVLPLPNNDPWKGKVNSLYSHYRGLGYSRTESFDQMRLALGHVLQVEVDYTVFARFTGFDYLVDQLGTVPVDFPLEIRDSRFWDDKDPSTPIGAIFKIGTDVPLGGDLAVRCYGGPKGGSWASVPSCFRALVYMRSRHGKVGTKNNNNYKRDKRQQSFLFAAVDRTITMLGGDPNTDSNSFTLLANLRDAAVTRMGDTELRDFWTDLPLTDADLLELFNLFNGSQSQPLLSVTLKPDKYAYHVKGTRKYALKIDVVRALTAQWFAPVP